MSAASMLRTAGTWLLRLASVFLVLFALGLSWAVETDHSHGALLNLVVVIVGVVIPAALGLAGLQRARILFWFGVATTAVASAVSIHGLYRLTDTRTHIVAALLAFVVVGLVYGAQVEASWTSEPRRRTKQHWAIRALQWTVSVFFQALIQIIIQLLIEIVFAAITGGRGGGSSISFGGGKSGGGGASGRW